MRLLRCSQAIAQNGKERFDIEHIDGEESDEHEDGDGSELDSADEQSESSEESEARDRSRGTERSNGARGGRAQSQVIEMVSNSRAHNSMRDSDTRRLCHTA